MHAPEDARARLLAAAVAHVERQGIGDLSLRELAAAIGTSHRMLIYHFGSKRGLMAALVRAVEAEQRAFLARLAGDPAVGPAEAVRTMWRRLADPRLHPQARLFFEVYSQALQGRPGTEGRSEERRVGKEWRLRWGPDYLYSTEGRYSETR